MQCQVCGAEFEARVKHQRFCSDKCKDKTKIKKRQKKGWRRATCKQCGGKFWKQRSNAIYCSDICKNASRYGPHYDYVLRICPVCEVYFLSKFKKAKYCCRRCKDIVNMETQALRNSELIEPIRRCATCGKPTNNYRCEECWSRLREGPDIMGMIDFETELST